MVTKKPKILIATWFNCLRNIKTSIGAFNLGYELELLTKAQGWALASELQFGHIYNHIKIWETPSQLEKAMIKSDADIIWCHNEPDLMAQFANFPHIKRDRIVIHDCHDLPSLHPGYENNIDINEQEKAAIENSEYVSVPTPDYVNMICNKYPTVSRDKIKVIYSCSPKMFFPEFDYPRVNGMLYCGQVNVPEMNSKLHYRDCVPLFSEMTNLGIPTHIYSTTPNINMMPYTMAGACSYGTLRMYAAIHQYTRYDYGFVGSNIDCIEIQKCMPNKLFDCIAAGIPLIALNAKTAGDFIEKYDIGVSVQGIENLKNVPWKDKDFWEKKRKNVRDIRHKFTIENEVNKLLEGIK